jgi:hypothetical protein
VRTKDGCQFVQKSLEFRALCVREAHFRISYHTKQVGVSILKTLIRSVLGSNLDSDIGFSDHISYCYNFSLNIRLMQSEYSPKFQYIISTVHSSSVHHANGLRNTDVRDETWQNFALKGVMSDRFVSNISRNAAELHMHSIAIVIRVATFQSRYQQ